MELLEEQRETWGTRGGFVLAAVGSAVGLGNLWGFPYKLYSYGGGAFLVPYIAAMIFIGIPMLVLEFSIGHFTQRAAPGAFARTGKRHEFVGWWGIILGFVIITYYPVILAYCFSFMYYSVLGIFNGGQLPWAGEGIEGVENAKNFFFNTYLDYTEGTSLGAIRSNIVIPLVISWAAMYFCIFRGVKLVGKIVWLTVPLPWLMLAVLTVRGLTLPGSMKGLVYFLDPVWSELAKPTTWRFAFGQVFFSLSLAYGVMITYASFLHNKSDINNNAAIIGLADFATSFIAGLAIFATLGGMTYITAQAGNPVPVDKVLSGGPGLAFVAFPYALAQLPGSAWWSFVFFFTLVTLGIDSAFSITESVLAAVVDKPGFRRAIVLPVMSFVGLAFGLFFVPQGGLNWLGTIDAFVNGTWGIALLGLLQCLVLGWLYRINNLRNHANERSDWSLGKWWNVSIRVFIPIVLGTLFLWSLLDDLTQEGGFIFDDSGNLILPNYVGMTVMIAAPILAMIMTMIKSPFKCDHVDQQSGFVAGKAAGALALMLALSSAILIPAAIIFAGGIDIAGSYLMYLSLALGVAAIICANYVLEKHDVGGNRICGSARWAGIIASFDISAFIAVFVNAIVKNANVNKVTEHHGGEHLSGVSYVILSVVFLMIIGGLGWCFYRAMMAAARDEPVQYPD